MLKAVQLLPIPVGPWNKARRSRSIFVEQATHYLKKLQEETTSLYIFPSKRDRNLPISKSTLSMWFRKTSKKIGREIFPYLLRHSRATELYKNAGVSDKIAQKFMGHSKNMSDVYTHLDSEDVKEAMSKTIYNLEELPPKKKEELEKRIGELEYMMKSMIKTGGEKINLINSKGEILREFKKKTLSK